MKTSIEILKSYAKKGKVVFYNDLLKDYNSKATGRIKMPQLWDLLRDVGSSCFINGEPPLNSLVINAKTKLPSDGFYIWLFNEFNIFHEIENNVKAQTKIFEIYKKLCFTYWGK